MPHRPQLEHVHLPVLLPGRALLHDAPGSAGRAGLSKVGHLRYACVADAGALHLHSHCLIWQALRTQLPSACYACPAPYQASTCAAEHME